VQSEDAEPDGEPATEEVELDEVEQVDESQYAAALRARAKAKR
jgi:hypothetical protein